MQVRNIASVSGGAGHDTITGTSGNDVLAGSTGDDTLAGGLGDDTYLFNRGDQNEIIQETGGESDTLLFGEGITKEDLWFHQRNNSLVVTIADTNDDITVEDWYSGSSNQIDEFRTSADASLTRDRVDLLVTAMAAFDVPSGSGSVIPQDVKQQMEPILASSWQ